MPVADARAAIRAAHRVVIKVGSSSITSVAGGLDPTKLSSVVSVVAAAHAAGREVVLVSSGAIAAGLAPLGFARRPTDVAQQQAAASVGQVLLARAYAEAFAHRNIQVGQVLLTAEDVIRRTHYTNAYRSLSRLLELRVVPVVNENDAVATHEIRFGDNDRLAALVAHLVHADALVLLSDVDALYDQPPERTGAQRIATVDDQSDLAGLSIGARGSAGVGTGGMRTKVEAAAIATGAGVPAVVTSVPYAGAALAGHDVGTYFVPTTQRRLSRRLLWLTHAAQGQGTITVDAGAAQALVQRRKSLLPKGIAEVAGSFAAGDVVDVCGPDAVVIARGLVNYDSAEVAQMAGYTTSELATERGPEFARSVIHRDVMVIVPRDGRSSA